MERLTLAHNFLSKKSLESCRKKKCYEFLVKAPARRNSISYGLSKKDCQKQVHSIESCREFSSSYNFSRVCEKTFHKRSSIVNARKEYEIIRVEEKINIPSFCSESQHLFYPPTNNSLFQRKGFEFGQQKKLFSSKKSELFRASLVPQNVGCIYFDNK